MQASDIPALKFNIAFASAAGGAYVRNVPEASQIGLQDGAASLETGFPPLTMDPLGTPPFGQDFNGILRQVTQWSRWLNAGGQVVYDAAFSTAIAGYPKGCILLDAGLSFFWVSQVDDNTADPDAGGANWLPLLTVTNAPQGRLTLATNTPVMISNQVGKSLVYYTADQGNLVPVRRFGALANYSFAADLQCQLTAAAVAGGMVDFFSILDSGAPVVVFGPPWQTASDQGASSRGAAAALTRFQGMSVNAAAFTGTNGASTYSVGIGEGVYLGSGWIDEATAGQITCTVPVGPIPVDSRWGLWNAYNRRKIVQESSISVRAFMGLAEEYIEATYDSNVDLVWGNGQVSSASADLVLNGANFGAQATAAQQFNFYTVAGNLTILTRHPMHCGAVAIPVIGAQTIEKTESISGGGGSAFSGRRVAISYMG